MESKIEKIEGAYDIPILKDKLNRVIDYLNSQAQPEENKLDKAREEGYKKGYIDGQIEKINKPKPVVSEFDKTSYLN